jgi:hypothetical protein
MWRPFRLTRLLAVLRNFLTLSFVFAAVAFLWSFLGFLAPETATPIEVSISNLLLAEITGHILFGLVAAIPSRDLGTILLCGANAVLIDSDHLLSAAGFPVLARLSHSLLFVLAAGTVLALFSKRTGRSDLVFASAVSAVLAHFSFDALAGDGAFPFFAPLSFDFYAVPWLSWIPFEVLAGALLFIVSSRRRNQIRI